MNPLVRFHVFQPRPRSPHPTGRECERGGGTWVIAEEGSTIRDAQPTLRSQFIRRIQARTEPPPDKSTTRTDASSRPRALSPPSWVLNPTVYPLYPGASADYSSPPCCVSVCIGRMGSGEKIPRPGPVSSPAVSAQHAATPAGRAGTVSLQRGRVRAAHAGGPRGAPGSVSGALLCWLTHLARVLPRISSVGWVWKCKGSVCDITYA